jgi:hypothetical protein
MVGSTWTCLYRRRRRKKEGVGMSGEPLMPKKSSASAAPKRALPEAA